MANTPEPDSVASEHAFDESHSDTDSESKPVDQVDALSLEKDTESDHIELLNLKTYVESLKKQRLELEAALIHSRETRLSLEEKYLKQYGKIPYKARDQSLDDEIQELQESLAETDELQRLEQMRIDRLQQLQMEPYLQELRSMVIGSINLSEFYNGLKNVLGEELDMPDGRLNTVTKTASGQTSLHLIVCGCKDANAPLPDMDDATCLRDRRTKITLLLSLGADINARDDHGRTAFHYAVQDPCKDEKLIRLLLAYSADPFIEDNQGKTPIQIGDAFAIQAILDYDDGDFQSRIAESWSQDVFSSMDLFTTDPVGASQIMHSLYKRLV